MWAKNLMKTSPLKSLQTVKNILQNAKEGDKIQITGWVKSLRDQKENTFIDLSDGSTYKHLQILLPHSVKPKDLTYGSSILAKGYLKHSPRGQIELNADSIRVYTNCIVTDGYPFAPRKQYNAEYVRSFPHFRSRTNKFSSLLRIRSETILQIHKYFNKENFINVNTPILTSNDCEGAGEIFKAVPESENMLKQMQRDGYNKDETYFGVKTFLTVSGQLHLEAMAHGLSRVYTLGPTFRAENSRSRFHLSEFYMLEAEIAFLEELGGLIKHIEDLVKYVTRNVLQEKGDDVKNLGGNCNWLDKDFPVIEYDEAVNICEGSFSSKEDEMKVVKHCGGPVFVINWPRALKPFYMKESDNNKVAALDLLGPNVGEILGGSLREFNIEKLKDKVPENLNWYLDIRKFGGVPTGGFGLGLERFLASILDINNIKDTIPFPRWPHNCNL